MIIAAIHWNDHSRVFTVAARQWGKADVRLCVSGSECSPSRRMVAAMLVELGASVVLFDSYHHASVARDLADRFDWRQARPTIDVTPIGKPSCGATRMLDGATDGRD